MKLHGPRLLAASCVLMLLLFSACSSRYETASGKVLYRTWDEFHGIQRWPVEGADPDSFQMLNKYYGKDMNSAYHADRIIVGSDPATFVALSEDYAKDNRQAYHDHSPLSFADPASFEALGSNFTRDYARDKSDVYFQGRPIRACDSVSFRWVGRFWQVDSMCAYYSGSRVKDADPKTLVEINSTYAKDHRHVYSSFSRTIVKGADPETFKANGVYAKDQHGCYKRTARVPCGSR